MDYNKCPFCGAALNFENGTEEATAHLKSHEDEQLTLHPEINDEDDLLLQEYHEIKRLEGAITDD